MHNVFFLPPWGYIYMCIYSSRSWLFIAVSLPQWKSPFFFYCVDLRTVKKKIIQKTFFFNCDWWKIHFISYYFNSMRKNVYKNACCLKITALDRTSSETHGWFRLLSSRLNQPWVSDDVDRIVSNLSVPNYVDSTKYFYLFESQYYLLLCKKYLSLKISMKKVKYIVDLCEKLSKFRKPMQYLNCLLVS